VEEEKSDKPDNQQRDHECPDDEQNHYDLLAGLTLTRSGVGSSHEHGCLPSAERLN
jgi:hypothetical protein